MSLTVAAKRRPAALDEIITALAMAQHGEIPAKSKLVDAFARMGVCGLIASRGALFETLVVSEWMKRQFNAGQVAELYFWRDSAGHEVDLLIPHGNQFMPVEIKSGSTFSNDWTAALRKLSALFGDAALPPGIIYGGDGQYERDGGRVVGWQALAHSSESAAR